MPLSAYRDSDETWIVSCRVCNPVIPEVTEFDELRFKLVPYWVSNVEVSLDAEVRTQGKVLKVQILTITLRCKNGHLWTYQLQAGDSSDWVTNVLHETVINREEA